MIIIIILKFLTDETIIKKVTKMYYVYTCVGARGNELMKNGETLILYILSLDDSKLVV